MRQETMQSIAMVASKGQKYDEACKKFFRNRESMAPILKYSVEEFKDCSIEEIIRCIDADSIRETIPVTELPAEIKDQGTEMSAVYEKTVHYDVHFKVKNPQLSNEDMLIMLHIDFEVQNDYKPRNPKYPIVKRGIYYVAREISAQLGELTQTTNYDKLEKAYSIWICNENIPTELQNTVTRYYFAKEDVIGKTNEPQDEYDLMEVIIIRRGNSSTEEDIFQYLDAVFTSNVDTLKKYIDIPTGSDMEKEVAKMEGLGESLYNKAYKKAYDEAYHEAYNEACKKNVVKFVKKNYMRNGNREMALQDLQEELELSLEQAEEIFAKEIKACTADA